MDRFMQQNVPASRPVLTPRLVVSVFVAAGAILIAIGLAIISATYQVVEISYRYDIECIPSRFRNDSEGYILGGEGKECKKILTVPKYMKQPIFVYYQLENFYQNHFRYVKSRNDEQLLHHESVAQTQGCGPVSKDRNDKPIVPCGLVAWSLFNDTYNFSLSRKGDSNPQILIVNKTGIAWESDKKFRFGKKVFPMNFQESGVIGGKSLDPEKPLGEQEDLIVWMRTAAFPTFRKLYGRIEADLAEGDLLNVTLMNNYNSYSFGGSKTLVLSTTSWIGGKNYFLGIAYLSVGYICLLFAIFYTVCCLMFPYPVNHLE